MNKKHNKKIRDRRLNKLKNLLMGFLVVGLFISYVWFTLVLTVYFNSPWPTIVMFFGIPASFIASFFMPSP